MTPPVVSVVIPTFNRADLIGQTIDSVLAQTMEDYEVIIVDDGSTDNTSSVVNDYDDPRIRYIKNHWTGLPSVNRNIGIQAARGRYMAFVDSDDLWLPEKLATQVDLLESRLDLSWCFTHFDFLDHQSGQVIAKPFPDTLAEGFLSPSLLLGMNVIGSMTPLVRKEAVDLVGLQDEGQEFRFVEDWDYWLRLTALQPGWFIPAPLALYRRHVANATVKPDPLITLDRCFHVLDKATTQYPELYGPHYSRAVQSWSVDLVKQLIIGGHLVGARNFCSRVSRGLFSTPKLCLLGVLASLPRPVVARCLKIFRLVKSSLNMNTNERSL